MKYTRKAQKKKMKFVEFVWKLNNYIPKMGSLIPWFARATVLAQLDWYTFHVSKSGSILKDKFSSGIELFHFIGKLWSVNFVISLLKIKWNFKWKKLYKLICQMIRMTFLFWKACKLCLLKSSTSLILLVSINMIHLMKRLWILT